MTEDLVNGLLRLATDFKAVGDTVCMLICEESAQALIDQAKKIEELENQ